MAYSTKDLSALTYANGFTLWHYKTADAAATVDTSGYFNEAAAMLRVGDFVLVNAAVTTNPSTGSAIAIGQSGVMVVVSNINGVVDLADLSAFGTANTD
jgi:hypothetical protein